MANTIQFPPTSDKFADDIPVWMTFYCAAYSTFSKNRTRSHIIDNAYNRISVPYPKNHTTTNDQVYVSEGSKNNRLIETGDADNLKDEMFKKMKETVTSNLTGGGIVTFDHMETVLSPGARRTHSFEITMISKSEAQAEAANNIALTFQTNTFPTISNNSILTMIHPALWCFKANIMGMQGTTIKGDYWDGTPLASVLKSCDINRSPILNTPFIGSDFNPVAINLRLKFIELEPALQAGDGSLNIISRSERLANS